MKNITTLILLTLCMQVSFAQVKLSSHPDADATIFLDFDGHYVTATAWNGGQSFYCEPSGLSEKQITEIFHRVSEDFRPFDINVTTDSVVYLAAPLTNRIRIIITPTSNWFNNVGGVSFTRSFTWGDGTPAFVFPDRLSWSPKIIAECSSHEIGHTLGLSHQARYNENCGLVTNYNEGEGSGEIAWAPVMGNSYYRNLSSWNNGPTPYGCDAEQDNLSIITGINGFGYRTDDHGDEPGSEATKIELTNNISFKADGIISTNYDKDAFEINFKQAGRLQMTVKPFSVGPDNAGANLDVRVVLLDGAFDTIGIFDPKDRLDVEMDIQVNPGKHYLVVDGAGNEYASEYGSLGAYDIAGNFNSLNAMPVSELTLKGSASNEKHQLEWILVCDETIRDQVIEVSENSRDFKSLARISPLARKFDYQPLMSATEAYYRIKVTTLTGSVSYSNIVSLNSSAAGNKIAFRSTTVTDRIEISSETAYRFILTDLNGKILQKGNGTAGMNVINLSDSPRGIYIVQIINNSHRITQRVVRL